MKERSFNASAFHIMFYHTIALTMFMRQAMRSSDLAATDAQNASWVFATGSKSRRARSALIVSKNRRRGRPRPRDPPSGMNIRTSRRMTYSLRMTCPIQRTNRAKRMAGAHQVSLLRPHMPGQSREEVSSRASLEEESIHPDSDARAYRQRSTASRTAMRKRLLC